MKWVIAALLLAGCGSGSRGTPVRMPHEVAGVDPDAQTFARETVLRANEEQARANDAKRDGDETVAQLRYERARALYARANAETRLAKAKKRQLEAASTGRDADASLERTTRERAALELESADLEKKLSVIEQLSRGDNSAPSEVRLEARLAAARTSLTEAALLCGAATVLGGKDISNDVIAPVRAKWSKRDPATADLAQRARAACLDHLTLTRRAANPPEAPHPDALLKDLSSRGDLDVRRDERGVIVVIRNPGNEAGYSQKTRSELADLAKVAKNHPKVQIATFGLPSVNNLKDLFPSAQILDMGDSAPLVASSLVRASEHNRRIEIVFVADR